MKNRMKRKGKLFGVAMLVVMATACGKDDHTSGGGEGGSSKYIVAGTSSQATYLLSTDQIHSGTLSIVGNGLEVDNATTWIFHKKRYAYRLVYNQGNAGVTTSYQLNASGLLEERSIRHEIQNRFTTHGTYGDYIITAASGATVPQSSGVSSKPPYGITFTMINAESQTLSTKTVVSENMVGTGEYCTVSGIVESKGKIYSAVCPEGVSVYGVQNYGNLLSDEAKQLINTEGGIAGTVNPNRVWVAIYDGTKFDSPKIITDNRISYATSRYRSQYYSNIDVDADGNVYVFSASHATTQSGIQKTSLPSGVLRIKVGTEEFDPNYYVNLEDATVAGRAMYKVWHITHDYFLMQMYAEQTDDKSYQANTNKLGIFKASDKRFTWVSGLPSIETISALSKNAYVEHGEAFIAVTTVTQGTKPTIYIINPQTATATAGLVVTADAISAVGKLNR